MSLLLDRRPFRSTLLLTLALALLPAALRAQETTAPPSEEIVANLAAGRVVVAVVKDAIIIATVENPIETQTHPPVPVQLNGLRAGVLLGAVDWFSPSSQVVFARLDQELPHLHGTVAVVDNRLDQSHPLDLRSAEATDLEAVGLGVWHRLNQVTADLHAKVSLPAHEPVVQLVLAGYVRDYGPEVWLMSFDLVQELRQLDYYDTRVTRPIYLQSWPPEKTEPHTLLEYQYPPEIKSSTLLDLLKAKDPRIEKICSADPKMRAVSDLFLQGEYKKILAADAVQFLRTAMDATSDPKFRQTMAIIRAETGFEWILKPPAAPKYVPTPQQAEEEKNRPPERPSLLGPPQD
ncbi:MAG TPA: hypothetical protein VGD60_01400 [Candidatus Acidoferrales bacterium]